MDIRFLVVKPLNIYILFSTKCIFDNVVHLNDILILFVRIPGEDHGLKPNEMGKFERHGLSQLFCLVKMVGIDTCFLQVSNPDMQSTLNFDLLAKQCITIPQLITGVIAMKKIALLTAIIGLTLSTSTAFAASSFQNTCSNIEFVYMNNTATLKAVCLKRDGTANPTSLAIKGISNNNGKLVMGGGASSFQKSCGNIRVKAKDTKNVILKAFCRTTSGSSNKSKISLDGISNNNGSLTY